MVLKIGFFPFPDVGSTKGWFMFDEVRSKNKQCCTEACCSVALLYLSSNILVVLAKLSFHSLAA